MAINEDGLEEYIGFGTASLSPFDSPQKSVGKELSITYKFFYQATSPFPITMTHTKNPGSGEITNFGGSFIYRDIETQKPVLTSINTDNEVNTQVFPASSLCFVQIIIGADCSTSDGELTASLS